ncbi:uncharacterized protein A4U43_C03F28340 [Asparagus officinalis]|uniref:Nuclease associated modular domain-containing protein n=1 Tax=Asparagus officinalis TaxID=4686 RepID=A0A5P1FEI5_ASPOF|nr:uncharacterized protein LOC109834599 isoform X1 [Asparagus officinalis]XP_020258224.1 uncharacterized protein LOC109834599 isoform X2 [Asparagus officinalis]ONK76474.1 uncharacterized protein A4U43_C03F28340 [Asparagus officinalis]
MASATCSSCWSKGHFSLSTENKMLDVFPLWLPYKNCQSTPRIRLLLYGKSRHKLSIVKHEKIGFGGEDHNQISRKFIFEDWSPDKEKAQLMKAIATVEREVSKPYEESPELHASDEDSIQKERLRRTRISKANKGNVPWNKGRKHSPETLQRIRERTRIAMQDPKVKMKLMSLGHAQTEETRIKIAVGVRKGWQRRREMLMVQEGCLFEWQNIIAEASRKGHAGDDELQWDSYKIIDEQLKQEWLESIEKRKTMPWLKASKRAPKSLEQRRKISEAISAKWADPEYRGRVCSALSQYHGVSVGVERKRRRRPSCEMSCVKKKEVVKGKPKPKGTELEFRSIKTVLSRRKRHASPSYKDPLASFKLEMIRKIREERTAMENKQKEATERAKLLITKAEKAAKALEVAAQRSPLAQASLIETRKLIAEATRSIESIENGQPISHDSGDEASFTSEAPVVNHFQSAHKSYNSGEVLDDRLVNGFHLASTSLEPNSGQKDSDLKNLEEEQPKVNGSIQYKSSPRQREGLLKSKEGGEIRSATKSKKWVCGRLVEVDE